MKKLITFFVTVSILFISFSNADSANIIRCASTTSTQNSGFFDYILPLFEKRSEIKVLVVAVGTGAALEIGKRGDADLLFVHSKEDELRMVAEGWFVNRYDVMYNDFVIIGPPDDPAGIRGMDEAVQSFKKIGRGQVLFVSRSDNSGTYKKEVRIWKQAGIDPKGKTWYLEVGQGMGKTLRIANEKRAYTLTDRGTYLSLIDREQLEQAILVEGDPFLFNQYGVMAVNPERHPHVKYEESKEFINWFISEEGQNAIASFRDSHGNQLFHPNALR